MKKIIALLLALTVLAGVTCAFAQDSKEDVDGAVVITGQGTTVVVWSDVPVGDDDVNEEINKAKEAAKVGSPLDVLPQELRDQLPEGFTVVNEIGAMQLTGIDGLDEVTVSIKFDTPYEPESKVFLALGIPAGEETEWLLAEAKANEEKNVEVTFTKDVLEKIGEKYFAVMAISEA